MRTQQGSTIWTRNYICILITNFLMGMSNFSTNTLVSTYAVYLGAVATHPQMRGRGLAGDLVLRLAKCGKRAEILCKEHRVSFYTSLGFSQIGEFSICHFSK